MNRSGTKADPIILGDEESVQTPDRVPDRAPEEHQPAKRGRLDVQAGTGDTVIHSAPAPARLASVVEDDSEGEGEDEGEGEVPETQPVYCADQEEDPGSGSESDPKVCIVDACDLEEGQTGKIIDPDTDETVTVTATFDIDPHSRCCDFCLKRDWA